MRRPAQREISLLLHSAFAPLNGNVVIPRLLRSGRSPSLFLNSFIVARLGLERPNVASSVIIKNPGILGGVPVFANTRVPFQALLDYLEGGETLDEFLEDFPTVTREAAISALEEAKALVIAQLE